tara:strand:- start:663 stop:1511 length:849 start_codon:yes stop_codon:yes gene_type:complete
VIVVPENFSAADISFRQMSEEEAVNAFQDDGYFDYRKRTMRYRSMSRDSSWATAPATMFVAYYEDKPVGVIGFSKHKGKLLGAGIHVRKEFRQRGLSGILVDKIVSEKGSNTLYVNIASDKIANTYRDRGFGDMNINELPEDSRQDLEGLTYADQVQKWMIHKQASWFSILKKKYNFQFIKAAIRKIVEELDGKGIENKDLMKRIGEEYRQFIITYGNQSEKAQLVRIKNNPMTFMPYTKLMRNYGYYPQAKQGTVGAVSYYGMASKSPNLRTTYWTMGEEE